MSEFFSYDPLLGVEKLWDYDEMEGKAYFRDQQDVEPLLSRNMEARNTRIYDGKQELRFYCAMPPIVQIELKNKGIDIYSKDPEMIKRMFAEINANYPYLKVTDMVHL
jgi:hypothetical protein